MTISNLNQEGFESSWFLIPERVVFYIEPINGKYSSGGIFIKCRKCNFLQKQKEKAVFYLLKINHHFHYHLLITLGCLLNLAAFNDEPINPAKPIRYVYTGL